MYKLPRQRELLAQVPLLDVSRQNEPLQAELQQAIQAVMNSGRFVLGPECEKFETEMAAYCQVPHAMACASGSDALLLALMALGIGRGDEVIVPTFTFFATASAVARLGARVVFADIDPDTMNLDPVDTERRITSRTKAIIPVHLFGQAADMTQFYAIAQKHHLALVEDVAQALGAEWLDQPAGSWGELGCLSFYPTKNLGACGDAGMVVARDEQLADRIRLLRGHGMRPRYYHQEIGINSRLDTLQAALLSVKLKHLETWTQQREEAAERYTECFTHFQLRDHLQLPTTRTEARHAWNQYVVRVRGLGRDQLRESLKAQGVATEIYYPLSLHEQACFRSLGYHRGDFPVAESTAACCLALPIFPGITEQEQYTVVARIAAHIASRRALAA